jgi:hypothetical protein
MPAGATAPNVTSTQPQPRARTEAQVPAEDESESETGTVKLEASPVATVSWGETGLGETPVEAVVPSGEQTFLFKWGNQTREVRVVVEPAKTTTHVEKL